MAGRANRSASRLATIPMTPGCQSSPEATTSGGAWQTAPSFDPVHRRGKHIGLDALPLLVELVELDGERPRFGLVVGREQARPHSGLADPAAGVDPRPEHEAELERARRMAEIDKIGQRPDSGVAPPGHDFQALHDEGAVDTAQRNHVANGAQRDQIEPLAQIGLGAVAEKALLAQPPIDLDDQ